MKRIYALLYNLPEDRMVLSADGFSYVLAGPTNCAKTKQFGTTEARLQNLMDPAHPDFDPGLAYEKKYCTTLRLHRDYCDGGDMSKLEQGMAAAGSPYPHVVQGAANYVGAETFVDENHEMRVTPSFVAVPPDVRPGLAFVPNKARRQAVARTREQTAHG